MTAFGERVIDEQQAPDTGGWQDGLDAALVARLIRPLVQPGVIRSDLADGILTRTERMANRLPLLGEVMSRLRPEGQRVIPTVPIVYATRHAAAPDGSVWTTKPGNAWTTKPRRGRRTRSAKFAKRPS